MTPDEAALIVCRQSDGDMMLKLSEQIGDILGGVRCISDALDYLAELDRAVPIPPAEAHILGLAEWSARQLVAIAEDLTDRWHAAGGPFDRIGCPDWRGIASSLAPDRRRRAKASEETQPPAQTPPA